MYHVMTKKLMTKKQIIKLLKQLDDAMRKLSD